ncbi:unnamed protein product [Pedinophyceae sp. YPF-701]|nr:unnamed protein product [Pedinophyceae sp. YPF-701]
MSAHGAITRALAGPDAAPRRAVRSASRARTSTVPNAASRGRGNGARPRSRSPGVDPRAHDAANIAAARQTSPQRQRSRIRSKLHAVSTREAKRAQEAATEAPPQRADGPDGPRAAQPRTASPEARTLERMWRQPASEPTVTPTSAPHPRAPSRIRPPARRQRAEVLGVFVSPQRERPPASAAPQLPPRHTVCIPAPSTKTLHAVAPAQPKALAPTQRVPAPGALTPAPRARRAAAVCSVVAPQRRRTAASDVVLTQPPVLTPPKDAVDPVALAAMLAVGSAVSRLLEAAPLRAPRARAPAVVCGVFGWQRRVEAAAKKVAVSAKKAQPAVRIRPRATTCGVMAARAQGKREVRAAAVGAGIDDELAAKLVAMLAGGAAEAVAAAGSEAAPAEAAVAAAEGAGPARPERAAARREATVNRVFVARR